MNVFVRILKLILPSRGLARGQLLKIVLFALVLNVIFGIAFFFVERGANEDVKTIWDAIWWSMVTMTTVGYGDLYAKTFVGRFFISYPCMIIGIGIIGYLVGSIAEMILENISKRRKGLMHITDKNHVIVCNCPQIEKVLRLVDELRSDRAGRSRSVVVISDKMEEIPEIFEKNEILFVRGDPTKEEVLHRANVLECAGVFVLAEDPSRADSDHKTFAVGTIIELLGKERGVPIKVVVELVSKENLRMMRKTSVDGIVSAEGIIDCLMAQEYLDPGINEVVHQLLSNKTGSEFYTFETRLDGYSIAEIQKAVVSHPTNIQVIGVIRGDEYSMNPAKDLKLEKGDKLVILANDRSDFQKLEDDILIG